MNSAVGISHLESRIAACVIEARQRHVLQRVTVFSTTLCRIRQGEKVLHWEGREMRGGTQHLVLLPAGCELSVTNIPGSQGHYVADAISFPAPMLRDFQARYRQQLAAHRGSANELCVALDAHTNQAWNQLLLAVRNEAPDALRTLYGEAVLLSLALAGLAGPLFADRHDPLCERLQQLLISAPSSDWTVEMAARKLNLGASTLRRQLSSERRSFRQILEEVRLGTALLLLQTSSRQISEIAASSGYASASRFAVRFRSRFGLSPRDLRAAVLKEAQANDSSAPVVASPDPVAAH
jgi:AraC-like DNA-binding protein